METFYKQSELAIWSSALMASTNFRNVVISYKNTTGHLSPLGISSDYSLTPGVQEPMFNLSPYGQLAKLMCLIVLVSATYRKLSVIRYLDFCSILFKFLLFPELILKQDTSVMINIHFHVPYQAVALLSNINQ